MRRFPWASRGYPMLSPMSLEGCGRIKGTEKRDLRLELRRERPTGKIGEETTSRRVQAASKKLENARGQILS